MIRRASLNSTAKGSKGSIRYCSSGRRGRTGCCLGQGTENHIVMCWAYLKASAKTPKGINNSKTFPQFCCIAVFVMNYGTDQEDWHGNSDGV